MFRLAKAGTECQLDQRKMNGAPAVVFKHETRGPDLQTQMADKLNTQAVLQLSSE
jgi:hypothetical protein